MPIFEPSKRHLREALLFCFNLKKTAAESCRMLMEAYGDHAPSETTCKEWFRRFSSGDFDVGEKQRSGRPKVFEDKELQSLIDEDPRQTQEEIANSLNVDRFNISKRLKAMGKVYKEGRWVPYDLTERDMERRKTICEMLLDKQKRKGFLHRIVTGDEKWIYFDNPKRRKAICDRGQPSQSTPKRNIHGKKAMLCIWWDHKGVIYHELLKPGQTITGDLYKERMIRLSRALHQKRPEHETRQHKVILLHDNARPHVTKAVKETLEALR